MREYFVYLLRCADSSFYIGVTNNIELRLGQHKGGADPTCYTFSRRPVTLVHLETYREVMDAIAREKQLKRWSRKKKKALMKGEWEVLHEYAECINESHHTKKPTPNVSPRAESRGDTA